MIVVLGSINVDLIAGVQRLPHAGETLVGHSFSTSPGGKGANQALAARRAGARVALYGAVGRDAFAEPALALLRVDGVDVENVQSVDRATGIAMIHVDVNGENAITVVAGANARATAGQVAKEALGGSTTVVMQLEIPQAESRCVGPTCARVRIARHLERRTRCRSAAGPLPRHRRAGRQRT
jgi:ribokinase